MRKEIFSDAELYEVIVSLKKGDVQAFEKIYQVFSPRIYGNILKMVKSQDRARELHQDVFVKVWEKRNIINPELSFTSYLFQISKNTIYNYIRRYNLELQVQNYMIHHVIEGYTHIEEGLEYAEQENLLRESISMLPPKRKIVFEMCKIEGKTYEEVSQLLGISISTVNDHIVKATKFIKDRHENINNGGLILLAISSLFNNLN